MTDFNQLIPEMRDWNNGTGIDIHTWVGCTGNFKLAVGYSTIFWPEFVEFNGYVLRAGFSETSLKGFERQCGGDRKSVEGVMNHLHIADIHCGSDDVTPDRVVYLGKVLREIYQAKLLWQFPQKRFEVDYVETTEDDLIQYQITFFQNP